MCFFLLKCVSLSATLPPLGFQTLSFCTVKITHQHKQWRQAITTIINRGFGFKGYVSAKPFLKAAKCGLNRIIFLVYNTLNTLNNMAQKCLLYANICLLLLKQSKTMIHFVQNILQHNLKGTETKMSQLKGNNKSKN